MTRWGWVFSHLSLVPTMLRTSLVCALLLPCSFAIADDKEDVAKLRKEIVELRRQLASKEAELAKLDPVQPVPFLFATSLKVGTAGPFGAGLTQNGKQLQPAELDTFKVVKVIDTERAVVRAASNTVVKNGVSQTTYGEFILIYPTKGLADEMGVKPATRAYRVTGTEKFNNKTYFTVEPFSPPK